MERIFYQNQNNGSTGSVNSGVLVLSYQSITSGPETAVVVVASASYDYRSCGEYAESTGAPLLEDLAKTGSLTWVSPLSSHVVVSATSDTLSVTASNLVLEINRYENWFATLVTPQNEQAITDLISSQTSRENTKII